jgi:hypothetical protein
VKLESLQSALDRRIRLSPEIWAKALLLGKLRTTTNSSRAVAADRGAAGNTAVDLHGAIGELVLLHLVVRLGGTAEALQMASHMFSPEGGQAVVGPDLLVSTPEGVVGIDAKTFDCAPNKRFFAINDSKHRSLQSACGWYFALLSPSFGQFAELTRLVPFEDVETWETASLRSGPQGSASRNLPIGDFLTRYSRRQIDLRKVSRHRHDADVVGKLSTAASVRDDFVQLLPAAKEFI